MKRIVIIGSSGHAKVLLDIARLQRAYEVCGLVDRYRRKGEETMGYAVLGGDDDLPELAEEYGLEGVVVAVGDNFARAKVAAQIRALCPSLHFATLVHPGASIAEDVSLGDGTVVMAGAVVNPCSKVGRLCILNTNCALDHDSSMEDYASLAPGALTGGGCQIGEYSAIGIGAVLVHGARIGSHTVVGAGSLVMGEIGSGVVAYGSPAKVIRNRQVGDPYLRAGSTVNPEHRDIMSGSAS